MERKKLRIASSLLTRSLVGIAQETGNIYQSLNVIGERAEQISREMREELRGKVEDFAMPSDSLDEIFENPEQIEISKYYERLPKAHLIALEEFLRKELFYRLREESPPPTGLDV